MAKWIKFNLEGNDDIGDDEVIREIHRGQIHAGHMLSIRIKPPLASVSFQFDTYGLGWFVGEYRGNLCSKLHLNRFLHRSSPLTQKFEIIYLIFHLGDHF